MRLLLPILPFVFGVSAIQQTVLKVAHSTVSGHGGKEFVQQNSIAYELVSHPSFAEYQLRVAEPTICDPSVKQYSGYLDIAEDKHIFFWFFESRLSPEDDPLVLWLNGGPGCSSTSGLLFELGPCSIAEEGNTTVNNPYSWNTRANIIFLDQPINVGYSYAANGTPPVKRTPVAATDVYVFLELFVNRFKKYADLPFHIAAESYGGAYAPHIANVIHKKNKELVYAPPSGLKKINLESLMIGNGLTDPRIQMPSIVDFACDSPQAVLNPKGLQCNLMRVNAATCQRLIETCYKFDSRATCTPAALHCWNMFLPLLETGLNIYDLRMPCDRSEDKDGPLCYKELRWIEKYMNEPRVKAALGANPDVNYSSCNLDVANAFMLQGDGMRNSAALLTDLINDGLRLLIYDGNFDLMCNIIGEERWISQLESKFHAEFSEAPLIPWTTIESGKLAGSVRRAGGNGWTAGNVTFVNVNDAGHMVPHDQPEAALDLMTRWIMNLPLG